MGTFNHLPPTIQDRLSRLEDLFRQGLGSLQMSFSVAPNGTVQFGNGFVAPAAGGALDLVTNVRGFQPPQPTVQTGNDGVQSWVDITIPSSLYGDSTAAQQIADWDVEVTPGIYANLLPYASSQMTPAHTWTPLVSAELYQTDWTSYVGYGSLAFSPTINGSGTQIISAWGQLPAGTPAGTMFTASLWARHGWNTARSIAARIRWFDDAMTVLGTSSAGTPSGALTSSWQRISVSATTPPRATRAAIIVEVVSSGATSDGIVLDHAAILPGTGLSPDVVSYGGVVYRRVNAPVVLTSSGPRLRIESLPPNVGAEVRIRGVSKIGVPTQWSTGIIVNVAADDVPPTIAPSGLTAAGGNTTVTVWWEPDTLMPADVANWQGTFDVQLTTEADAGFTTPLHSKRVPGGICGFDGLTASTVYRVRVRAVDAAGNVGPWSASVTVTTDGSGAPAPAGRRWVPADMITTFDLRAVNAVIGNATITNAKINDLSVSKLTAGTIGAHSIVLGSGGTIGSQGFSPGSGSTAGNGWQITGSGNAEFNSVIVRGTVYATSGVFTGEVLGSTIIGGSINIGNGGFTVTSAGNTTIASQLTVNGAFSSSALVFGGGSTLAQMYRIAATHGFALGYSYTINQDWLYENSIQISTNTRLAGVNALHTGFLVQCDSMNGWGTAHLRFHQSASWGVYDTSPSMAVGTNVFVRPALNPPGGVTAIINGFGLIGYNTSRLEFKENIADIDIADAGALIDALRPRTFTFKPQVDDDFHRAMNEADVQFGFIAEEVADVHEHLVSYYPDDHTQILDLTKYRPLMWREHAVIALLTRTVQDLRARVAALEAV